ncbi:hypothetical protein FIBSPDRAFT_856553 [Athelia psychrophila]|uniref:Uncharacterized protein n=1 Tax=Athelia psychrophila TaxID=1759441 RepID=A0A166N982_9AGAM|nr:hypothetical protein FIBSPDRAFT_856553 [Fibularhizoctonia sp. CBS 109695]
MHHENLGQRGACRPQSALFCRRRQRRGQREAHRLRIRIRIRRDLALDLRIRIQYAWSRLDADRTLFDEVMHLSLASRALCSATLLRCGFGFAWQVQYLPASAPVRARQNREAQSQHRLPYGYGYAWRTYEKQPNFSWGPCYSATT